MQERTEFHRIGKPDDERLDQIAAVEMRDGDSREKMRKGERSYLITSWNSKTSAKNE